MKNICLILVALAASFIFIACNNSEKQIVECQKIEIPSKSGILRGYLKGPSKVLAGKKKAPLIVIMHVLDDWCEFDLIKKQADAYAQEGYAVLTVDFDGHGYSDGKFFDMTLSKEFEDAEAIMNYAKSLKFALEINLIGHSQGGVVASVTAVKFSDDIKRLVLLAPGGMLADNLRAGRCFGVEFDPSNPPEKFVVFGDEIGRDYVIDAMKMDLYKMAEGFSGHNILLVSGGADPLVKEEVVRNYEKLYSKPECKNKVSFVQIPDAPHDFAGFEPVVIENVLKFLK